MEQYLLEVGKMMHRSRDQSGTEAVCKTADLGSIPTLDSTANDIIYANKPLHIIQRIVDIYELHSAGTSEVMFPTISLNAAHDMVRLSLALFKNYEAQQEKITKLGIENSMLKRKAIK